MAQVPTAPIISISPWAMLMTPISPKVMARPSAISTRIEPSETPKKAFLIQLVTEM